MDETQTISRPGSPRAAPDQGAARGAPHHGATRAATDRPAPEVGPLVAVCGLCGGAGASTLAYLLARHVARGDGDPVLVCDTGGTTAGLSAYARTESPSSLARLADAVAHDERISDALFAHAGAGLRVIAGGPQVDVEGDERGLARVLADARSAHRLTIVDCGTLARRAERQVLASAGHVAWIVLATPSAVLRGRRLLELVPPAPGRRELLVARQDAAEQRAALQELRTVAGERDALLVLMPYVGAPVGRGGRTGLEEASVTLDVIAMALRR